VKSATTLGRFGASEHVPPLPPRQHLDPYGVARASAARPVDRGFLNKLTDTTGLTESKHTIWCLRDDGLIPNSGSLSSQVAAFEQLTSLIPRAL